MFHLSNIKSFDMKELNGKNGQLIFVEDYGSEIIIKQLWFKTKDNHMYLIWQEST